MTRYTLGLAVAATMFMASEVAACPAYGIAVTQVLGNSYNPVDDGVTPVMVQLTAIGAPLPAECEDVPVTIEGAPGDPQPFLFTGAAGARLVADLTPGPEATRSMSSLILTAEARARLIQGQPVNVQVGQFQAGQFLRTGPYTTTIRVSAGASEVVEALNATVEPALLFQLSSADGVEEILLNGDPQAGTSGSTVFFYRTNTDLRVSASSMHGGALVHERGEATGRIPYNASLDGTALNFNSGSAEVDFGFAHTNLQARTIAVEVPAAGPLIAGRYEDVITFSFAPY
jgi:hypothetical protein